jgi:hypothetical protein
MNHCDKDFIEHNHLHNEIVVQIYNLFIRQDLMIIVLPARSDATDELDCITAPIEDFWMKNRKQIWNKSTG